MASDLKQGLASCVPVFYLPRRNKIVTPHGTVLNVQDSDDDFTDGIADHLIPSEDNQFVIGNDTKRYLSGYIGSGGITNDGPLYIAGDLTTVDGVTLGDTNFDNHAFTGHVTVTSDLNVTGTITIAQPAFQTSANLLPAADVTYDLGNLSFRWLELHGVTEYAESAQHNDVVVHKAVTFGADTAVTGETHTINGDPTFNILTGGAGFQLCGSSADTATIGDVFTKKGIFGGTANNTLTSMTASGAFSASGTDNSIYGTTNITGNLTAGSVVFPFSGVTPTSGTYTPTLLTVLPGTLIAMAPATATAWWVQMDKIVCVYFRILFPQALETNTQSTYIKMTLPAGKLRIVGNGTTYTGQASVSGPSTWHDEQLELLSGVYGGDALTTTDTQVRHETDGTAAAVGDATTGVVVFAGRPLWVRHILVGAPYITFSITGSLMYETT